MQMGYFANAWKIGEVYSLNCNYIMNDSEYVRRDYYEFINGIKARTLFFIPFDIIIYYTF